MPEGNKSEPTTSSYSRLIPDEVYDPVTHNLTSIRGSEENYEILGGDKKWHHLTKEGLTTVLDATDEYNASIGPVTRFG